ncbi:MAG TPA: DUF6285 domain-containing protein [Rhizomicrobium sp.]|nr:DUF6285 domain-containing protein [Rhizomicrobium sp.]
MMDQPSIKELVDAVRDFLEKRAMPELKGHTAFHARVAANALGIVSRQLEHGAAMDAVERARLTALLGHDGTLEALNRELCAAIRGGLDSPELRDHLERTVRDKVAIDQPNYAGAKR